MKAFLIHRLTVRAAVLGLLLPARPLVAAAAFDVTPFLGKAWYGVYLAGNKIGYGSSELERIDHGGREACRERFEIFFKISLGGEAQTMTIREERVYLPDEGLVAFSQENTSALGPRSVTGERVGDRFKVVTPDETKLIPAGRDTLQDHLSESLLVKNQARVGDTARAVQFEPTLLKWFTVIHRVEKIETVYLGGVPSRVYHFRSDFPELGISSSERIDENLHTLEATVAGLLTIREEGEAEAKNLSYLSDVLNLTAITPSRTIPSPQSIRKLTLKLGGVEDPARLAAPPRQRVEAAGPDTCYLRIEQQEYDEKIARSLPMTDAELKPFLEPTLEIQSADPEIHALARRIAGEEKNSYRATVKLVDWVFSNLKKSFLAANPNARDVLKKKSGDCKAHAVLFTALARSLGIPARTVSGLVCVSDGKFYYHEWAETYTGFWLPVDPVFGQVNADATHLRLCQGDLLDQIKALLGAIGKLSIEVIDFE